MVTEFSLEEPPFDLSLYAVLLLSFPQEVGFEGAFPVLGPGGTLGWETLKVEDGGELLLPDGSKTRTRKVSTRYRPWSVWFQEEAPYIVRIVQRLPDGTEIISERCG